MNKKVIKTFVSQIALTRQLRVTNFKKLLFLVATNEVNKMQILTNDLSEFLMTAILKYIFEPIFPKEFFSTFGKDKFII